MFELFVCMMKEEWRLHSTIFGSISFALFPVMIFFISFMSLFLLPLFKTLMPLGDLILVTHALFVLLGIMVGAFGLLGAEVMNRRFGQASLLAYSGRTLPVSENFIFLNFVLKDIFYYFILWVLPFVLGFSVASPFIGMPLQYPLILAFTLAFSFLTGLSFTFFLSILYTRSKWLFSGFLIFLLCGFVYLYPLIRVNAGTLFSSVFPVRTIAAVLVLNLVFFVFAVVLFRPDYSCPEKRHKNIFGLLTRKFALFPYPYLVAKDLIDLYRSGGIFGQTIFSFLLPLGVIWFFLCVISPFITFSGQLMLFAVLTGVISSTMYTWLTQFDSISSYACLPVSVSEIISGKICSFTLLQSVPVFFLGVISFVFGEVLLLIPVLILCFSVSFWGLCVSIYLTGLNPSVLVYDAKVLLLYLILTGIPVVFLIVFSFINQFYAVMSVLIFIPAWYILKKGIKKWDTGDFQLF